MHTLSEQIEQVIARLCKSFRVGNAIKNGTPVAIVGETNTGKSTLLNTLLKEDKAIVSDIHGTTRDTIEDTLQIDGYTLRLIDTAGIRNTDDAIENLGIQRSYKMMEQADIVILIVDASRDENEIVKFINAQQLQDKLVLLLFNKSDICEQDKLNRLLNNKYNFNATALSISAKNGVGKE